MPTSRRHCSQPEPSKLPCSATGPIPKSFLSLMSSPRSDDIPQDPFQMRIRDTTITLIFGKYGKPPSARDALSYRDTLLYLLFRAQAEIVKNVVTNRGDGTIPTPNIIWRHAHHFVTVNQHLQLPWSILSQSLMGLMDFYDRFYAMTLSVMILEDKAGILGELTVGIGY